MKMLRRVAIIALFLLAFVPQALADLPPLIPRDVLFGNPEKAAPKVSPNGKMLAYIAPDNGVLNVWVRTIGQQDDRVVTSDRKRGVRTFFWQQDSDHILYIQDQGGDENWHVYQTSLGSKETRDLTPFKGARADIVAINPNFPDQILVSINTRDPKLFDVYRIDLKSGKAEMDTQNPGDVSGWTADNDLQVRAAQIELPGGGNEIRVRDSVKSPWRTLQKWDVDDAFGWVAGFSPDNKNVWLVSTVDANAARLVEADMTTGKPKVVAEDNQYDVDDILRHPRKRTLEAVRFIRTRGEWMLIDKSLQADFDALKKVRDGDFSIISRDLADKTWIVAYLMDNGPVYYYAYDRGTKKSQLLFSNRPALEKYKLAQMQPISYQSRDGMTINGYLTLPIGVEPKNLPMVLYVHGGPWARDVWGLNSAVQWFANRGYAVLQVNYRGSTGYGKKHMLAARNEFAGKMHNDLIDGVNWAVEKGYADPKRVGIFGGSYGGYATLVGLTFTPNVFACGVDIVGPSNLATLIKSFPAYWQPFLHSSWYRYVGNPDDPKMAEDIRARSPLFKIEQIKAPLLIAQGANDPRVTQAESEQIVKAMRQANKPVEYIVYMDEGHGFARPENRLHFYAKAEEFLSKHLGGRFEPMQDIKGHAGVVK
ncbi:MAG TPA: S9 family peptidase [Pyrinomonadaceae bacterium]|jgi:dipeptidyl aminopeptidase/acylaminoacyl peptidase